MGSLVLIMAVFMVTAILVKVAMEPLPFFIVTMLKIVIINCESTSFSQSNEHNWLLVVNVSMGGGTAW